MPLTAAAPCEADAIEVGGAAADGQKAAGAERAGAAQLQRAGRDGRAAGVSIGAAEDKLAGVELGQTTCAAWPGGQGCGNGDVECIGVDDRAARLNDGADVAGSGERYAPACKVPPLKLNVLVPRDALTATPPLSAKSFRVPPFRSTVEVEPAAYPIFSWFRLTLAALLIVSVPLLPLCTPK